MSKLWNRCCSCCCCSLCLWKHLLLWKVIGLRLDLLQVFHFIMLNMPISVWYKLSRHYGCTVFCYQFTQCCTASCWQIRRWKPRITSRWQKRESTPSYIWKKPSNHYPQIYTTSSTFPTTLIHQTLIFFHLYYKTLR